MIDYFGVGQPGDFVGVARNIFTRLPWPMTVT